MARPRTTPVRQRKNKNPNLPLGEGGPAGSPRRRKPSPTGKVAGPKALTDEGSQPTQRIGPGLNLQGSPPHPSRLCRATLSKQERALNLPLGEGAARRRRKRGGTRSDFAPPHTRPGLRPVHPLPGEGPQPSLDPPSRKERVFVYSPDKRAILPPR